MTDRPTNQHETTARLPQWSNQGLGPKRTMLVMVVVVGCFAVLWPKIFYPMLVGNANSGMRPGPEDRGCCDVISEMDVDTIKIMSELCRSIIDRGGNNELKGKEIVAQCRKAVLETCGIDISAALHDRISLGHSTKQILEEVRSLNGTMCLQYHFGVSPWKLGVGHRVNAKAYPANSIRQERPAYIRPGAMHPAFRERGRAIPETGEGLPRRAVPPKIVEGRPGPIPGIRPAMGGQGIVHPKQHTQGLIGILMPIYTIIIVIFFTYTCIRLASKKKTEMSYEGAPLYPPCDTDDDFRKEVFDTGRPFFDRPYRDNSKIGHRERDARDEELDQLRRRLRETELAMERIVTQMDKVPLAVQERLKPNGALPKDEDQGSVTVLGMVTTASAESGKKWSRPDSPVLPHMQQTPKEPSPPPQQIFLDTPLPPQSQILVAELEAQKDSEDDCPVVLAGKMTLSVISLDSEDSSSSGRREDEGRRTSSSNVSEEFEKINAADLEEQIDDIIEQGVAVAEDIEELSPLGRTPLEGEEEDVMQEIKTQLKLEDDFLKVLREEELQSVVKEDSANLELENLINIQKQLEKALFEDSPPSVDLEKGDETLQRGKALFAETSHELQEEPKEPESAFSVVGFVPDLSGGQGSNEEVSKRIEETFQNIESDAVSGNETELEKALFEGVSHELQEKPMEPDPEISVGGLVPDSFGNQESNEQVSRIAAETSQNRESNILLGKEKQLGKALFEEASHELQEEAKEPEPETSLVGLIPELLGSGRNNEEALELEAVLDIQQQLEKALFRTSQGGIEEEKKVLTKRSPEKLVEQSERGKLLFEEASSLGLPDEAQKAETENSATGLVPSLPGSEEAPVEASGFEISKETARETADIDQADTLTKLELGNESLSQDVAETATDLAANEEAAAASPVSLLPLDLNTLLDNKKQQENPLVRDSPEAEDPRADIPLEAEISGDERQETPLKESLIESDIEAELDAAEEEVNEEPSSSRQIPQVAQNEPNNEASPAFDLPQEVFQPLVLREHPEGSHEESNKDEATVSRSPINSRIYRLGEPSVEQILSAELGRNSEETSQADALLQDQSIRTEEAPSEEEDVDGDLDVVEQIIEEIHYETDEEDLDDDQERVNGVGTSEGSSRNGAEPSETAAENDISENELVNDDDEEDEEIEEIIEYVDNTDEEGEEIIEVNGNERHLNNGNHAH
ncbi:uro-adherence factor A-like isoform X2 [Euwallacea fornicatus]|uniref:uro-adherence factor A-like isoform X2 n=1 Tax=Euwallacea fornicatus TaxID=995702 RepID=UPI00338FFEDC